MRQKALQAAEGKTDLLLRFFESHFFDEWIALVYLYKYPSVGVQDYLCNKLYELPDTALQKYLLQFVYLAVSRPGSPLERVVVDICSKSFSVAVKVYWLLLALTQDHPKNRHLECLKDCCERAALEGHWDVPFSNPRLDPLSPGSTVFSPALHPEPQGWPFNSQNDYDPASPVADSWSQQPYLLSQGLEGVMYSAQSYARKLLDAAAGTALDSDSTHSASDRHSSFTQRIQRSSGSHAERYKMLRQQLGDGEGVTALLEKSIADAATGGLGCVSAHYADDDRSPTYDRPLSPTTRLRHDTFGATLDFMQELCDASSTLTSISQEQRQMALWSALESINQAIEASSRDDMAIWFPMGNRKERVLRLTSREAVLLNSREKAPFMLFVEVLQEPEQEEVQYQPQQQQQLTPGAHRSTRSDLDTAHVPEPSAISWGTNKSISGCADSANSVDSSSPASMVDAPTSAHDSAIIHVSFPSAIPPDTDTSFPSTSTSRPPPLVIDSAILSYTDPHTNPTTSQPPSPAPSAFSLPPRPTKTSADPPVSTPAAFGPSIKTAFSLPSLPTLPDSFRPSASAKSVPDSAPRTPNSALPSPNQPGLLKSMAQKSMELATAWKEKKAGHGSIHGELGEGPVPVERLAELLPGASTSTSSSRGSHDELMRRMDYAMASLRGDAPLVRVHLDILDPEGSVEHVGEETVGDVERRRSATEAVFSGSKRSLSDGDNGASGFKALNLLSKFSMCRRPLLEYDTPTRRTDKLVSVRFEVAAGLNLPIPSPYRRSRRVPSQDAIDAIADKYHILMIPPPADLGPPLKLPIRRLPSLPTIYAADQEYTVQQPPTPEQRTPEPFSPQPPSKEPSQGSAPFELESASNLTSPSFDPDSSTRPPTTDTHVKHGKDDTNSVMLRKMKEANAVYGERWVEKVLRIQKESPEGRRKGWALRCAIVKSGDDCRQELLAVQLIRAFHDIFHECGLPLWVRPYEVLVTSNRTALIELIPDCLSLHTVKHRSPPGTSFSDYFFAKFGKGTPECAVAQRKFTESTAAYSIICYLLQIKDRHNGNIMLDDEGHMIHIDFGFMLGNSPGGVNFESAPFKLTRELLEVMDSTSEGLPSELFDYFKVLCIQGFLAVRKHSDRILMLVKMMAKSNFPCFGKSGERTVKALEKRFHPNLTEVQCVQVMLGLITESLDAWRTRQYDYYQRVLNGIL